MDDVDRALLELAGRRYLYQAHLEAAIRDELHISVIAFWARVSALVDHPPVDLAAEYAPTIARLRRLRASRQRQRHTH